MKTLKLKLAQWITPGQSRKKVPAWLIWICKGLISVAVLVYVGLKLYGERTQLLESLWSLKATSWGWVLLSLALLSANIGLEAQKWMIVIRQVYPSLGFREALRGVVAGISTGIFTPNRIGEYAGRLWSLPEGKRLEAGALTFISRVCQMAITLLAGVFAIEYLNASDRVLVLEALPISETVWDVWRGIAVGIAVMVWGALLLPQWWAFVLNRIPIQSKWYQRLSSALSQVKPSIIWGMLGLSSLRFMVFTAQYLCLMFAFGGEEGWGMMSALIVLVFWTNSAIPSITLTELGIRESVALVIMGGFGLSTFAAFSSTFLLYWINLVIPGLLGVWLLYRIRSWNI